MMKVNNESCQPDTWQAVGLKITKGICYVGSLLGMAWVIQLATMFAWQAYGAVVIAGWVACKAAKRLDIPQHWAWFWRGLLAWNVSWVPVVATEVYDLVTWWISPDWFPTIPVLSAQNSSQNSKSLLWEDDKLDRILDAGLFGSLPVDDFHVQDSWWFSHGTFVVLILLSLMISSLHGLMWR